MRRTLLAASFLLAGVLAGGWYMGRAFRQESASPLSPTRLFQQVLTHVQRFGVDSLPEGELYRLAADGLVRQLNDEYAAILPRSPRDRPEHDADPGGLGLQVSTRQDRAVILAVIPGSPADREGLRAGDHVIEVNGISTDPVRRHSLWTLLSGAPGSVVEIRARRPGSGALATWRLVRETPRAAQVSPAVQLSDGVGYVAVGLPGRGAAAQVEARVHALVRSGIRGLMLDLRGASQGDLDEAVRLAGLFLERGTPIVEVRGRGPETRRYEDRESVTFGDLPLVVLVDGATADAAEVVAAALQENDRALVVGQTTFGRGLSPEVFPLGEGTVVRISTGRWVTPVGRAIQLDSVPPAPEARPVLFTRAGRRILGGGGVVPDSLVPPDTLLDASRQLFRLLDARLPDYYRVVRATAAAIAATATVDDRFEVGAEHRAQLYQALTEAGISLPRDAFDDAARRVGRDLGDEIFRAAGGEAAVARYRARRDAAMQRGHALLAGARTPGELIGLSGSPPEPRTARRN